MKMNFSCSGSLTHFVSHPLEGDIKSSEENCIYNAEFQPMIDCHVAGGGCGEDGEDYGGDETVQFGDKKKRLSNHQVKSLEKIFEIDNKLDPDRKVKVARDLGLQPRQVAIWFQNRRARWKTKQLERDYNLLKDNYDVLKRNYHKLQQEKESITKELVELKAKVYKDTKEDNNAMFLGSDPTNTTLNNDKTHKLLDVKDGLSDSDSSGVLNDENMNISNHNISWSLNMTTFGVSSICSSSSKELIIDQGAYQQLSDPYNDDDESCNIFLVDQEPNFCWY